MYINSYICVILIYVPCRIAVIEQEKNIHSYHIVFESPIRLRYAKTEPTIQMHSRRTSCRTL
jgi:hypothetical protein